MNRHQRRALAKVQGKTDLGQAAGKLQQAIETLQSVKHLDDLPQQMAEAHRLMTETHAMLGAIVEDFQGMADQVEALKQTMFCHRPDASATFQSFLENIQKERSSSSPP